MPVDGLYRFGPRVPSAVKAASETRAQASSGMVRTRGCGGVPEDWIVVPMPASVRSRFAVGASWVGVCTLGVCQLKLWGMAAACFPFGSVYLRACLLW